MRKVVYDRCGTEMKDDEERFFVDVSRVNGSGYAVMPSLDLCPSCNEQLQKFLSGQKLEVQA